MKPLFQQFKICGDFNNLSKYEYNSILYKNDIGPQS